jgi:hypothetical protein
MKKKDEATLYELHLLEQAKDLQHLKELVESEIEDYQNRIEKISRMNEEEFMQMISKSLFGVASKGYYIEGYKRKIEFLQRLPRKISTLIQLQKENPKLFNHAIQQNYSGNIKRAKTILHKLAEAELNTKITDYNNFVRKV